MTKLPYFQFYADDYLSSPGVTTCDLVDEGIYIRLLAYSWKHDGCQLPYDMRYLRRLCKGARAERINAVIDRHFEKIEISVNKYWIRNSRLYTEFCKASGLSSKRSYAAKCKWNKETVNASASRLHMQTGMQNDAIPDSRYQKNHLSKNPPVNPSVHILQKHLKSAFEKKYGSIPVMSYPGIGRQLKVLLEKEKFTEEALKEMIDWFLTSPKASEHPTPAAAISMDTVQRWQIACPEEK